MTGGKKRGRPHLLLSRSLNSQVHARKTGRDPAQVGRTREGPGGARLGKLHGTDGAAAATPVPTLTVPFLVPPLPPLPILDSGSIVLSKRVNYATLRVRITQRTQFFT